MCLRIDAFFFSLESSIILWPFETSSMEEVTYIQNVVLLFCEVSDDLVRHPSGGWVE